MCQKFRTKLWLEVGSGALRQGVIQREPNGRKLVEIVHANHPNPRVVYMSDYTDNVVVHNGVLDAVTEGCPYTVPGTVHSVN